MYKIICRFFIILSRQGGDKGPNSYLNTICKGLSNVYAMKDGTVRMLESCVKHDNMIYCQISFLKLEENAWQMQIMFVELYRRYQISG